MYSNCIDYIIYCTEDASQQNKERSRYVMSKYQEIGQMNLKNLGEFVVRLQFQYFDEESLDWKRTKGTGDITLLTQKTANPGNYGVKDGMKVKLYADVTWGHDRASSEIFIYRTNCNLVAQYTISGTTLDNHLNYAGILQPPVKACAAANRADALLETPAEQELSEEQAKTLLTSLEATDLSSNGSSGPFAWDIALDINRGDITKSSANVKITFLSCELTNAALDFKNPKAAVDMKVYGTGVNAELGIDFDRRIIYLKGLLAFLNYNREFNYTLLGF